MNVSSENGHYFQELCQFPEAYSDAAWLLAAQKR